jgi:hypothetical protein
LVRIWTALELLELALLESMEERCLGLYIPSIMRADYRVQEYSSPTL